MYKLTPKELAVQLKTDLNLGLSKKEAEARLKEFGENELKEKKRRPVLFIFLEQLKDFLILILIAAALISGLIGELKDSVAILAIVLLNAILGASQEVRAERAIAALKKLTLPLATLIRDGKVERVSTRNLVPGDIILLETGSYVPADGRLVESINLKIDEAPLTGESVPVGKISEPILKDVPVSDQKNMVFMGTMATYGRGKALVTKTGMKTELGRIAELVQAAKEEPTPLEMRLETFGKWLGTLALLICLFVFVAGIIEGQELFNMFLTAVSLAVAAIPEGLPAVITISLAIGAQRMARSRAVIRKLPAVETLGCVTAICSDKTGTLTENKMMVNTIFINGQLIEVTGQGYQPSGEFFIDEKPIDPLAHPGLRRALIVGALCNDARLSKDEIVGDPTEGALIVVAAKAGLSKENLEREYPRRFELPFDSTRKRMSTLHLSPTGEIEVLVKGAVEEVLVRSTKILIQGNEQPLSQEQREEFLRKNAELAKEGLRILGLAYRKLKEWPKEIAEEEIEKDLTFIGLTGMMDLPRAEVKAAVETCFKAGIKPIMVTGDHRITAEAVARDLGITEIHARISPEDKLKIIDGLKVKGEIVAMTGDGVNDAPALKRADIGVAMGITGTDVAREASDMVLTDDNFATIVAAIEEGRRIYDNIKKFVWYLLSANTGEIFTVFFSILLRWPLPLLPLQILWVNLVTDGLPALALSAEPAEKDLMQRPPRHPREAVLTKNILVSMVGVGLIMAASSLALFFWAWQTQDLSKARTLAFTTLAMLEMFHVLNCRSEDKSIFRLGFLSNPYLIGAIISTVILQAAVIYLPFLQGLFKTAALNPIEILLVLLLGSLPLWAVELRKLLWKRKS